MPLFLALVTDPVDGWARFDVVERTTSMTGVEFPSRRIGIGLMWVLRELPVVLVGLAVPSKRFIWMLWPWWIFVCLLGRRALGMDVVDVSTLRQNF